MDLKVEGSDLQRLLEAAVMQALGEAGRDALTKHVVQYLTTPVDGYGRKASPLLLALQNAAASVAEKHVREKMTSDPEFIAAIDSLYVEAFKKFNSAETREKTIERMSYRLSKAFAEDY